MDTLFPCFFFCLTFGPIAIALYVSHRPQRRPVPIEVRKGRAGY